MKCLKHIISIVFIFISVDVISNTMFQRDFTIDGELINCCILQVSESNYLISYTINDLENYRQSGRLLILDDYGNIILQKSYDYGANCGISHIKNNVNSNTLYVAYYIDSIDREHTYRDFIIDEIDDNLDVLNTYTISQHQDTLGYIRKIEKLNDSSLLALEALQIGNQIPFSSNLVNYNIFSSNIIRYLNNDNYIRIPFDIMISPVEETISLFYFGNIPGEHGSNVKVLDFDYCLNPINYCEVSQPIFWYPDAKKISDSIYLLAGLRRFEYQPFNSEDAICIHKMNYNHDTINGIYYYPDNPEDTILYPFPHNTVVVQDSMICVGGMYNLDIYGYPNQLSPCWVQLTFLDYDLNIEKQIYYGDGLKAYYGRDVITTSDGGYAICGIVSDQNASNPQPDLFVLKVNSEGLITGNHEIESPQMTEVIIWPNPGSDVINLKSAVQLKNAVFELYNASGNLCHTEKLSPGTKQTINAAHLSQGIYTYRIIDGNRLVKSGKWIKK